MCPGIDNVADDDIYSKVSKRRAALDERPRSDSQRARACRRLASSLRQQYQHSGASDEILREILSLNREALSLYSENDPGRARACADMAESLGLLYDRTGENDLLEEMIVKRREALLLCPLGHPKRLAYCKKLRATLYQHYRHTGDPELLTEIIGLERELLSLCPQGHPNHLDWCEELALSLFESYEKSGDQNALIPVIDIERQILLICSPGHPNRSSACLDLMGSLLMHYQNTHDRRSLEESIDIGREALSLCSRSHPDRYQYCHFLAESLYSHYALTSNQDSLAEVIELEREVFSLCPPDHPYRLGSSRSLVHSLHLRHFATGDQLLLTELVDIARTNLSHCPPDHQDRGQMCSQLATSLHVLFLRTNDQRLLAEIFDLQLEAFSLYSAGDPDSGRTCGELSSTLRLRYKYTNDESYLIEAVDLAQQYVLLSPIGHADFGDSRRRLARVLCTLYRRNNDEQLLEQVVQLYKDGLSVATPQAAWHFLTGLAWAYVQGTVSVDGITKSIGYLHASLAEDVDDMSLAVSAVVRLTNQIWKRERTAQFQHSSLNSVYRRVVLFLSLLINPALETRAQLKALSRFNGVGSDAFIDSALTGNWTSGLELFEFTQGLIWSQLLHHRDPQLEQIPLHLADQLKDCLQQISLKRYLPLSHQFSTPRDALNHQTVHLHALLQDIRATPGLERFMLGASYDTLRTVASKHTAVVLVNAQRNSYALILRAPSGDHSVPKVSLLPLKVSRRTLLGLSTSPETGRSRRGGDIVNDLLDQINGRGLRIGEATHRSPWEHRMGTIWRMVVKPVLDHLELRPSHGRARPRLYWCPTGVFNRLPLHAAGIHDGRRRISCADYVVSTYTPSLTILLRAQREEASFPRNRISIALVAEKRAEDPDMMLIPEVDRELEQIVAATQCNQVRVVDHLAGSTTVGGVSRAIAAANSVHLACHGVQDPDDAVQSGFCLGDGRLTIEHLMNLKLEDPFFAFLSACETAKGDTAQPDQVMHLAAAMLFCGFKTVVATMWAINDYDGPKIAKWFYEALFANEIIGVDAIAFALDEAVGRLRDSGVSPDRWAPFIHMGA